MSYLVGMFRTWSPRGSISVAEKTAPRRQEGSEPVKLLSRVQLFATPWTVAYQAPPTLEFSRQEYWSGLPFPSPGDLHDPGIEPRSPALQVDALPSEPPGSQAIYKFAMEGAGSLNIKGQLVS